MSEILLRDGYYLESVNPRPSEWIIKRLLDDRTFGRCSFRRLNNNNFSWVFAASFIDEIHDRRTFTPHSARFFGTASLDITGDGMQQFQNWVMDQIRQSDFYEG